MRFSYAHHQDKAQVRQRIDDAIPKLLQEYGSMFSDAKYGWEGDTLRFSFRAMAMNIGGTAELTDTEIIVDVGLPLLLRPLEGRVKSHLERTMDKALEGPKY